MYLLVKVVGAVSMCITNYTPQIWDIWLKVTIFSAILIVYIMGVVDNAWDKQTCPFKPKNWNLVKGIKIWLLGGL